MDEDWSSVYKMIDGYPVLIANMKYADDALEYLKDLDRGYVSRHGHMVASKDLEVPDAVLSSV